jgi:tRNA dimethylallyltransferase
MKTDTPVIAIVGPTAVGKSMVGEYVARSCSGEIVSADSMQVYRGMDIGTAKTTPSARRVPYHCLDLVEPGTPYSAALYQHDARVAIDQITARSLTPVLVGGTGLYVRAALDDMRFPPGESDGAARQHYEDLELELGAQRLHAVLAERDPESAALIHPHNVRRVIRALEMADEGVSYAAQTAGFGERKTVYPTVFVGLTMDRAALYARIEARVDEMIRDGLLDEVKGLIAAGYREALTATQAIGYKELVPVLENGADIAEAVASIKQATRRYAKRQLTWFRADSRVHWLDVTGLSSQQATTRLLELVESSEPIAPPQVFE